MSRSRINSIIYHYSPANIFGHIVIFILSLLIFAPFSFAQSCSVNSMDKDKEIRACQIEDMRKLINEARTACALGAIPAFTFSDAPIVPNITPISIRHIDEIKNAIRGISNQCGPARPEASFKDIKENDIISTGDFVRTFNDFVATSFCGDSVCQTDFEDLTTCGVDCGGAAQFYCNGIGACYAAVSCPAGKKCYPVLQDCLDNVATDCTPCTPVCVGRETKGACDSWPDGCGGLCWGIGNANCDCSANTCLGDTCTDGCGNVCPGTKVPDLGCAANICPSQTCSDGCGGVVVGTGNDCSACASANFYDDKCTGKCGICLGTKLSTEKPYQNCGDSSAVHHKGVIGSFPTLTGYNIYRCVGSCTPTEADLMTFVGVGAPWTDTNISVGQTYTYVRKPQFSDRQGIFNIPGSITVDANPGADCSCASGTYFDSACDNTCGGDCLGTYVRGITVLQECVGKVNIRWTKGNFPTLDGYYVYRCNGGCTPTEADRISGLIPVADGEYTDTTVVSGQTYSYSIKPHFTDRNPNVFSKEVGFKVGASISSCDCASDICTGKTCVDSCGKTCSGTKNPSCACAATTCLGNTCSNGCGGTCPGTLPGDCSCAANTCIGKVCTSSCGGTTCAGTKTPNCSCAADTCVGSVCSNGCGGTCAGTKTGCTFEPIQCKKWSCSGIGFCQQNHTETCSCPTGKKPVCQSAPPIACGSDTCPDTVCRCVD